MNDTFVFSSVLDQPEISPVSHLNEYRRGVEGFGEMIGQSRTWRQIVEKIKIVAPTDATILIFGETGTGKELVAQEIHRHSRRRHKPLIRVNCACIPKELYESEFSVTPGAPSPARSETELVVLRQPPAGLCFSTNAPVSLHREVLWNSIFGKVVRPSKSIPSGRRQLT
jgi:transcriptional regulator of aromatic amino acid metabolism